MNGKFKNNSRKWFNSFAVTVLLGTSIVMPLSTVLAEAETTSTEVTDASLAETPILENEESGLVEISPMTSLNRFSSMDVRYVEYGTYPSIDLTTTRFYHNETVRWEHRDANNRIIQSGVRPITQGEGTTGRAYVGAFDYYIPFYIGDSLVFNLHGAANEKVDTRTYYFTQYANTADVKFSGIGKTSINKGDSFDPMEGVSAFDFRNMDITKQLEVSGSVDNMVPGEYTLVYSVTDIAGRLSRGVRTITVLDSSTVTPPDILGLKDRTISVGDFFDAHEGITASDIVDGDLTSQIEVSGFVDTETAGIYQLTYSVTNSQGATTSQMIEVTVKEVPTIDPTTISPLTTTSQQVTGTGEPNGELTILNGTTVLTRGRVGSDGIYNVTIPQQVVGTTITARVENNGVVSEASTVVTQAQPNLERPVLHAMFADDSSVSGTVAGTSQFVAVYVNGVRQRTAAVNANRSFSIYTGDYNLVAGQTIQVAAVTRSSATGPVIDEGPKESVRIQDRFAAPVINPVHNDDTTVTGTIGGTARFVSVYIGGQLVQTAAVNANRTYSIDVSNHTLVAGQNIQVAGVTRDGGTGPIVAEGTKTTSTILGRDQLVAPVVNPVTVGDAFVKGTVGGTASFVAIYANGQFLRTAAVASDRSYEIYVGDHNLVAGQSIQVSAVTRESNNGPIAAEGPRTSTWVQDKFSAPVINPVRVGDAFVNGTIGGTTQFVGLYINGVLSRTAAVNSNGTYTIYVGDRTLVAGQNIQIAGVTRDGNTGPVVATGPMTTSTVLNSGQIVIPPTINAYFETEQFVTGTADRNGTHVGIFVNGEIRRAAAINSDGTYSIYAGDLNLIAGETFEIASITRTPSGLITETGPKKEATVLTKAITINRYVLRQDTITGKMSNGTSRVFLEVNGVQVRRGQVEPNGEFAVWASDVITSTTQRVELVVIGANGTEIGRFPVTVNPN